MTVICEPAKCTGCQACVQACPTQCIHMTQDHEGFMYPRISEADCTQCDRCQRVCPALHSAEREHNVSQEAVACWHADPATRLSSASGGVFSALASQVLRENGVVFGAAYNEDMYVEHAAVEGEEDISRLRGSKYLQSDVRNTYSTVKDLLRDGRVVLYSGTPCQIAGLRALLGKDDANLVTCDLVCHGVASPGLFAEYVRFIEREYGKKLCHINFRSKRVRWEVRSTVARFEDDREYCFRGVNDSYYEFFKHDYSLRPCCYQCPYVTLNRCGDVTIADFFEIAKGEVSFGHDPRHGVSKLLINTPKGRRWVEAATHLLGHYEKRPLDNSTQVAHLSGQPTRMPAHRANFFEDYRNVDYRRLANEHGGEKGWKAALRRVIPAWWIFCVKKQLTIYCRERARVGKESETGAHATSPAERTRAE